ncbi:MAG: heme exporter protein CcmB [Armatimonadota bacterium]|nr:heme exporter protein CcmB [Armatimonadota bacterium]MDR7422799.1 heme exporter protein CcmB [Armatimonadota bacterium]MDR7453341.1 heme exporter protein CcmB [Armatimonadota bacterium]MDR7457027.1 heme exporter protein CcmB [Armatimonadota bacterium]MDR7497209.1 heme exporter protein CcmB [Armatimonadota bacterium]
MRTIRLLVAKDLRLEWRTREITTTVGLLALLLVIVLAAVRPEPAAAASAMWVTYAFAATLGFTRAFALERDHLTGLRLAAADGGVVFLGKALVNWVLLAAVQAASLPAFGALFTEAALARAGALAAPLVLGGVGLAVVGTLFGGLIVQARLREALLPLLMLPVALPVLIAATSATAALLDGAPLRAVGGQLQLLVAFDILFVTASWLLFEFVLEE